MNDLDVIAATAGAAVFFLLLHWCNNGDTHRAKKRSRGGRAGVVDDQPAKSDRGEPAGGVAEINR